MKKVFFATAGVLALTLMSFANNTKNDIIQVDGNVVTVKNTEKVSPEDLKFLSENIKGWEVCNYQSVSNECTTKYKVFPDEPTTQAKIREIIAKYQ